MLDERHLLRDYVERGSEEAFRAIIESHAGMVYGAAWRVVHDPHLAEEVTQAVFIILARKAAGLRSGTILAGWLYRTARFVALEALRSERRRQKNHESLAEMKAPPETASLWAQIAPLLEEGMNRLGAADRNAVVLRYLEERSFAEVAHSLGTSEAAAKMRVGRALEKLRAFFAQRGVTVSVAALAATFAAHAAPTAPVGLSAAITTIALTPSIEANTTLLTIVKGAMQIMIWNKVKTGALIAVIALLLGGSALVIQQQWRYSNQLIVASLDPMAGEWEGTYEARGDGGRMAIPQVVALSIRTTPGGRSCEIEMRVSTPDGVPIGAYRFTHTLSESGNRITTVDDPQIRRLNGEGKITESVDAKESTAWRVAFRTEQPNGSGATECRWVRENDRLTISRHDEMIGPQGTNHFFAELRLQRRSEANALP